MYHCASEFSHGVNEVSHIIAANAYLVAFKNRTKAYSILNSLGENKGANLCRKFFETYEELSELGIAPDTIDWSVVVNMCSAVALGKPPRENKWQKLLKSNRYPWHYELRPWKYPSPKDIAEFARFRQRAN